ncbi:MAG: hypothetical protein LBL60_02470 [Mycoplasmataceae bacterium]|nr:hypothetical protein [Mycoplasmataceae bacterium]
MFVFRALEVFNNYSILNTDNEYLRDLFPDIFTYLILIFNILYVLLYQYKKHQWMIAIAIFLVLVSEVFFDFVPSPNGVYGAFFENLGAGFLITYFLILNKGVHRNDWKILPVFLAIFLMFVLFMCVLFSQKMISWTAHSIFFILGTIWLCISWWASFNLSHTKFYQQSYLPFIAIFCWMAADISIDVSYIVNDASVTSHHHSLVVQSMPKFTYIIQWLTYRWGTIFLSMLYKDTFNIFKKSGK